MKSCQYIKNEEWEGINSCRNVKMKSEEVQRGGGGGYISPFLLSLS